MSARGVRVLTAVSSLLLAALACTGVALAVDSMTGTDAAVLYSQQPGEQADPSSDASGKYRAGSSSEGSPSDDSTPSDTSVPSDDGAPSSDGRFPSDGAPTDEPPSSTTTDDGSSSTEPGSEDMPVQLTADDLERMNNGNITMLFSDEGYLTFLRGTFYEGTVNNYEEAIEALRGVASLLGLGKGSEFFAVGGTTNRFGYTYYTYLQRYGDLTIENAVLKVIVGPDGHTAGLVSSFTPNIGIAPADEESITAEQAIEVVKQLYPDVEFTFFPESTRQTSAIIEGVAYHVWAVFTDYPEDLGGGEGDRAFLEHMVAYDGAYLMYLPVNSTDDFVLGDDVMQEVALSWFDGLEPGTYTGEVTECDGTRRQITVPVARDASGKWYLADVERHILVADYFQMIYRYHISPWSSPDNTGWPEHYLLTYESYIQVFDFFDSYGFRSTDGFGSPILILTDYCDQWHHNVDNAGSCGMFGGWARFGASAVNDYGECIDVIAHEYMHGITDAVLAGDFYQSEPGAVNEALSDIMGNLVEMMLGETEDESWLIAENCGETLRSMSFPWLYKQPVRVGGQFYIDPNDHPSGSNDRGGIHTNSSLVNYLAWRLHAHGMSLEDEFLLWMEAINLLTPYSGFREVHHALIFAAEIRGLDVEWMGLIDMICEQIGY